VAPSAEKPFSSVTSVYSPYCAGRPGAGQHKQGSKQGPIARGCAGCEVDTAISYRSLFAFSRKASCGSF